MKISNMALIALPALAAATPVPAEAAAASDKAPANSYKWHVTGWSAGCARSGCYYDFNVTGKSTKTSGKQKGVPGQLTAPSFKAYCSGQQPWFRQCKLLENGCDGVNDKDCAVSARLFSDNKDPTNATIGVSFAFTDKYDDHNYPRYNLTGFNQTIFNQFAAPLQEFYVTPTQATGVL